MVISTKGRYALRVMVDLASCEDGKYVPLKDISQRQEISQKYLEAIMSTLSKAGLVDAMHGKGGGYKLNRDPADYQVIEILQLTEKSLAPVACLADDAEPCSRAENCKTLPMWKQLNEVIGDFFGGISVADLANGYAPEILEEE